MAMGKGRAERWDLHLASHGFVLPHLRLAPYKGENFLASSSSLRASTRPVKF